MLNLFGFVCAARVSGVLVGRFGGCECDDGPEDVRSLVAFVSMGT